MELLLLSGLWVIHNVGESLKGHESPDIVRESKDCNGECCTGGRD